MENKLLIAASLIVGGTLFAVWYFRTHSSPAVLWHNEERWTVVRDEQNRISEVVVHRRVERG